MGDFWTMVLSFIGVMVLGLIILSAVIHVIVAVVL